MSAGRMHADEVDTDIALVARLLTAQFPQWADLPIEPVDSSRTDKAGNLPFFFIREQVEDSVGEPLPGVFHHLVKGQAFGIGFLFNGLHLRDGNEFHELILQLWRKLYCKGGVKTGFCSKALTKIRWSYAD